MWAIRGILCTGPDSGRKVDISIIYLDGIWIFIEDLSQEHVNVVEKPESESVRFIVLQPDCRTIHLLFEDPTVFNNNGSLRRFPLCCEAQKMSF